MFRSRDSRAEWSGQRRSAAPLVLSIALALLAPSGPALSQTDPPRAYNVELVGQSDLGRRSLNAAVWAHRTFAYVGTTTALDAQSAASCVGAGVTIVDVGDPARPAVVGPVAERFGTSAEDVQVLAVDTPAFRGDLLATGIQRCVTGAAGGLSLWDVTDPRAPTELGFFATGDGPGGVHELWLFHRDGRTIGLLAVPFSESLDHQGQGDLRIVDLSDPRAPVQLAHWGIGRALGIGAREGLGRDSANYAHSVRASPDGRLAYVSYWDAGVVILDISDLQNPRYVGRTGFGPDDEGNAHSAALAKGGRVLVQADEDIYPRPEPPLAEDEPPFQQIRDDDWGYLRFWDVADPANPVQLATFATDHVRTDRQPGPPDTGWYTVHQPIVMGDRLYASWYSHGVRVLDIADPTHPREVGYFIPASGAPESGPAAPRAEPPFVWGVYARGDLILASDHYRGLYVLRDRSR